MAAARIIGGLAMLGLIALVVLVDVLDRTYRADPLVVLVLGLLGVSLLGIEHLAALELHRRRNGG